MAPRLIGCCLAALLASPAAHAQEDEWRFNAVAYIYLPSISGQTNFSGSGSGGGSDAGIDASLILDNLNFVFMGAVGAEKGRWGVSTDVVYLDIGDSDSPSRAFTIGDGLPATVSATVRYGINGWLWTTYGSWRLATASAYELSLIGGARLLDIDQKVVWQLGGNVGSIPIPDRAGERTSEMSNWDAIVGLKGRAKLGSDQRWILPFYFDIGTGESSLTWQVMAGAGYAFDWGDLFVAWRHVDYDMKSGDSLASLSLDGPGIAAAFRW